MKNIRLLIIPLILLTAVLPFLLTKNRLSTDITVLLPADKWVSAHMNFLRNSQIGSISAISINSKSKKEALNIPTYVAKFAELLKSSPSVQEVFFQISPKTLTDSVSFLCSRAPQILTDNDLRSIKKEISPLGVQKLLKQHYETLLRPGGLFQQKMIASDPLGLYHIILTRIQNTGKDSGFHFILHDNGLWSEDGKHFLILVYTNIPITDAQAGKQYISTLETALKKSFPKNAGFSYNIMSGHKHSIENRRLLQRDITVTLLVAAIGFFMLFTFFFKDWKATFVFLIPILGMCSAIGLTWLFFSGPSAIILGLGGTVIGIALDYGIHVFVAIKHSPKSDQSVKKLIRPLTFSALTTLGVFWAFFFSRTPGYHQLAFASTCGIAVSLLLSILCLPLIFQGAEENNQANKSMRNIRLLNFSFPTFSRSTAWKTFLLWLIFITISLFSISKVSFESDIRKLDGSGNKLKNEEEAFRKIWGSNSLAAVTLIRPDMESAMECHDRIAKFANKHHIANFQSLSNIWPSKKSRVQNIETWNEFWKAGNAIKLKEHLKQYGEKYGFSDTAFDPFFNSLYKQNASDDFTKKSAFKLFSRKFINKKNGKIRETAFFADTENNVKTMKKFTADIENCDVISPAFFGDYISEKILNDAFYIAIIALFMVIILAWLCLKSPAKTFIALIPVISSSLAIMPIYTFCNWKINAIALVALIVVTGLSIDYGIFAVTAMKNRDQEFSKSAFTALTISMLSTIIGSGALLWASHPALNSVGKVITIGVFAGYLSAVLIIPATWQLKRNIKN